MEKQIKYHDILIKYLDNERYGVNIGKLTVGAFTKIYTRDKIIIM